MWHEASVVEMRENHNVMVFKELLMAGDVELNPGPYPPGMFSFSFVSTMQVNGKETSINN